MHPGRCVSYAGGGRGSCLPLTGQNLKEFKESRYYREGIVSVKPWLRSGAAGVTGYTGLQDNAEKCMLLSS